MRLNVPIGLRWSDLDAYGHVNNVQLLRLLEEARIVALWSTDDSEPDSGEAAGASTAIVDGRPGADTLTLIARQEIEYLTPIPYLRQPLDIRMWAGRIGGASLELCYEIWSPAGTEPETLYARAATTLVFVEAASGRPRRINDRERSSWEPYLEDPIRFRRR